MLRTSHTLSPQNTNNIYKLSATHCRDAKLVPDSIALRHCGSIGKTSTWASEVDFFDLPKAETSPSDSEQVYAVSSSLNFQFYAHVLRSTDVFDPQAFEKECVSSSADLSGQAR
jgi:hypothetical protein